MSNTKQSWTESNTSLTNKLANVAAVSGGSLFVGTPGGGVFRSTDQGQSWQPASAGLPQNANVQSLTTIGNNIFAELFGAGVYRSTNDGASWTFSGLANQNINALRASGNGLIFAATDAGMRRSNDQGASWQAAGLSNQRVVSLAFSGNRIFAGTYSAGIYVSSDNGANWTLTGNNSNGLGNSFVTALTVGADGATLFAGTDGGGIYRSTDGGANWTAASNDLPPTLNVYSFAVSGAKLYAGSIYGVFLSEDNLYYLVMEIVKGRLLGELISEGRLDYRRAVKLLGQACEAIDAAHKQGIIHRDLKPSNIIIQNIDGSETVKVLDFGVARLREQGIADPKMTKPGTVMGTPQYMSPEQCRGKELGAPADVYSLGVIAYEMLTQRPPINLADDWREIVHQLQTEPPTPLRLFSPDVPVSIEGVIMRALEKDPANRQPSAYALAIELRKAVKEAGGGADPSFSQSTVIEERSRLTGPLIQEPDRSPVGENVEENVEENIEENVEETKIRVNIPNKDSKPENKPGKSRAPLLAGIIAAVLIALGVTLYLVFFSDRETTNDQTTVTISDEFGEMALVRGGKFTMGRNDGDEDERPAHEVEVRDFYLDKYEVTNRQYKKFVDESGHRAPSHWAKGGYTPELPVTYVTWTDATDYAQWAKKRLPTEAEWEYAARGGSKQYIYPWGNEWRDGYANAAFGRPEPATVTSFENDKSLSGVFGLAGNVSEWVEDLHLRYDNDQPLYPQCPNCRVFRGGNFKSKSGVSTTTKRFSDFPDLPKEAVQLGNYEQLSLPRVGFRCARSK